MRYDWACTECGATTEVERPMAQSQVGPRHPCKRCLCSTYTKKLNRVYLSGARSENSPFPMRLRHLEKPEYVRDDKGRVVGTTRKPVIFANELAYNEYLHKHDLVKFCDGEDSSVGPSQHSTSDFLDAAPPNGRAQWLTDQSFFTEDVSSVGVLKEQANV